MKKRFARDSHTKVNSRIVAWRPTLAITLFRGADNVVVGVRYRRGSLFSLEDLQSMCKARVKTQGEKHATDKVALIDFRSRDVLPLSNCRCGA